MIDQLQDISSTPPVAMNACSRQALPREIGGEKVCVLFGLDEDQSPLLGIALRILHQLLQLSPLVKLGNFVEVLNKVVKTNKLEEMTRNSTLLMFSTILDF